MRDPLNLALLITAAVGLACLTALALINPQVYDLIKALLPIPLP
jgi:hypothetical protein